MKPLTFIKSQDSTPVRSLIPAFNATLKSCRITKISSIYGEGLTAEGEFRGLPVSLRLQKTQGQKRIAPALELEMSAPCKGAWLLLELKIESRDFLPDIPLSSAALHHYRLSGAPRELAVGLLDEEIQGRLSLVAASSYFHGVKISGDSLRVKLTNWPADEGTLSFLLGLFADIIQRVKAQAEKLTGPETTSLAEHPEVLAVRYLEARAAERSKKVGRIILASMGLVIVSSILIAVLVILSKS